MKKIKDKKKQNFRWWPFLIVAVSILLFNVAYAIWGSGPNKSNMLTLISGWVSGIATAFIGVIAFVQNKRYKVDSDDSIEKQYQFETAKLILNRRVSYIQESKEQIRQLTDVFNCRELLHKTQEIATLNNPTIKTVQQNHIEFEVKAFYDSVGFKCKQVIKVLDSDGINSDEKSIIKRAIQYYVNACETNPSFNQSVVQKYILPVYDELVEAAVGYFAFLEADIHNSLARIRDYEFVIDHYGIVKNDQI